MASRGIVMFAAMLGGAAALATVKPTDRDATCGIICVDSVNECGERYGGCYDPCLESAPEAPPCTIPGTHIWYPTPPPEEITPFTDDDCSNVIICIDGVNDCIPDCKPWNITIPTCPSEEGEPAGTDGTPETDEPADTDDTDETIEAVPWQGAEEPVPEEPVDEEPVPEEPVDEEPVPEEPVDGEPVPEEPVDGEPVDGEPVDGEPVDGEPVDGEPVDGEPLIGEPVPEEIVPWIPDGPWGWSD
ncbi:hypothetical protein CCMA1212_007359 [Trichoderma ghanense]|uniref:Uncharacterized protein n=1 Tax=Trichoderma ghanense TaxID=65468 RepID=A0ABY2GYK1_9HYPO